MAVSFVSFSFSRDAQPEAQEPSSLLDDGFIYCILSPTGLQNSIRGPEGPFGRVWLSIPQLFSDVSDPQLTDFLPSQSYVIVQRPLNRPLNFWNGMFDRHQAEITVMQFSGHSLPVHQSMSVPWDFYLVPFRQPSPPTRFPLITAIGMCHFLPVHHLRMASLAGSKVKIQHLSKDCAETREVGVNKDEGIFVCVIVSEEHISDKCVFLYFETLFNGFLSI